MIFELAMVIRRLTTVKEVITELGGYDAVRELIPGKRKSTSAALNWTYRNKFPENTYAVMKAALEAKGATAPGDLWGMPEPEEASA